MRPLSRNQTIGLCVISLTIVSLGFYFYPQVKSQFWYYKKQLIYNNFVTEQSKVVAKVAEPWPHFDIQTLSSKEELPADYKILLAAFVQPKISKATFDDKTSGWIIQEESKRQIYCPAFPTTISRKIYMNFRKTMSHLTRYQYASHDNIILIETRLRAFSCEIEVAIKNNKPI